MQKKELLNASNNRIQTVLNILKLGINIEDKETCLNYVPGLTDDEYIKIINMI